MRKHNTPLLVVASLFLATLWGCGSNLDSGGDQTGPGTDITDAERQGSDTCVICHTAIVAQGWTGSAHDDIADPTLIAGCEGCHGGGQFHKGIGEIPFPSPAPAQCTAVCHTLTASASLVQISDSHNDDPATATTIEGFVVKTADPDGCQACHYSDHNPVLTINNEWANSGHGGFIATGPVTSTTADAWVHYNWDASFKADGTDADSFPDKDRVDCQRCHTATGISNFLTSPPDYDAAKNDYSHLSGWSGTVTGTILSPSTWGITTPSGQNEVLYCWGCHVDVSEATEDDPMLRNPGAITENYAAINNATTGTTGTAATVVYPDIAASNVCIGCHLGREIGQNIKNITDADGQLGFVNSHYLTAGGTVFNTSGYEYDGQVYSTFGFHKYVGVEVNPANIDTGTSGPCATCHMSVASGHTFVFVTKDVDGFIEDNDSPICVYCHSSMDAGNLEGTKGNFHTALEELNVALQARGIFFQNRNPYFFVGPGAADASFTNWQSVATAIGTDNPDAAPVDWRDVMGAAFNYNLFEHDPGAYAHNSDYALKLVADSIDFLDNGIVDASTDSLASTLIGQGMNIAGGAGYSLIHGDPDLDFADGPVAAAVLDPTGSQDTCSVCHPAAPHYGGYPTGAVDEDGDLIRSPQWVNNQATCGDCHADNDPSLNQPILTQYADSGHGDVAGIWTHEEAGSTCSRCHTTSGYILNLTGGFFSYGVTDPLQTLNCNACHTSVDDGSAPRRAPGAFTATWSANSVTASVAYPNVGDSNLCIRCHSARRAGANITPLATTTAHYIPAAAVVFGGTTGLVSVTANTLAPLGTVPPLVGTQFTGGGYEFAGQSYADLGPHKTVGGASGPCVGCHMSGAAGHTWNAVTKNEITGEVTAVNSSICVDCHGADMTPTALNAFNAAFVARLDVLEAQLNARSIFFNPANGSFYREPTFTTTVNNAYYGTQAALLPAVSTRDLQGAAFNFWLFKYHGADPAGYVHNSAYALELINDSADLLNDATIDEDF